MLHQVRKDDKNRAENRADSQDSSYAMFDTPADLRNPSCGFDFAWKHMPRNKRTPPLFVSKDAGRNDCRVNITVMQRE